jgi:hypothetical protein
LTVAAAALVFPASATATAHYFPKPRQQCRAGYVRRTVKVTQRKHRHTVTVKRAECVRTPTPPKPHLIPTTSFVDTSSALTTGSTVWFYLAGSVYAGGHEVVGLPITYTVTDATTRQTVGTFTGTSNRYALCTIATSVNPADIGQSFTGQAVAPYPACSLESISMPAADTPVVTASFAGNSTYGPSTSDSASF